MRKYLKYLLILLIPFLMAVSLRVTNEGGGVGLSVVNTRSSSLTFDGVDDSVDYGNIAALNFNAEQDFSVCFWICTGRAASGYDYVIRKMAASPNKGWNIYFNPSSYLILWIEDGDGGGKGLGYIDPEITDNIWHHGCFSIDRDGTDYFYIDTQIKAFGTVLNSEGDLTNDANMIIGHASNSLDGQLADVRIFNRALSPTEIQRVYRGDIITNGLVSGYPLQEGGLSEKAYDVSGNDNHGDLTNFTLSDAWANVQKVSHYNQQMGHSTEILGSELVTNGDMELDSDWIDFGTPTTNERSIEQVQGGTYSRKFTIDGTNEGIQQFLSFTDGTMYKISFWVYPDDTTNVRWAGPSGEGTITGLTQDSWNYYEKYWIQSGVGTVIAFHGHVNVAGTWYVDNVIVKEVTNNVPDGAKVPALADGSGIDAIGNAINNAGRGYNKSLLNVTN